MKTHETIEGERLAEARTGAAAWKRWGPYLSDRQWGTVREDYSPHGDAWDYFPHDHARTRAYRWGEDGIAGISDDQQRLCFALALWNGRDPILKERLFGLTGKRGQPRRGRQGVLLLPGRHADRLVPEDALQVPPGRLPVRATSSRPTAAGARDEPEYELIDTGVFAEDRYFDVVVEYAKAGPDDILIRISATNRGPEPAELHLLPHLWFRNTWSWGGDATADATGRCLRRADRRLASVAIVAEHAELGRYVLACEGSPTLLFTENETNAERLFSAPNPTPYVKDGIHEAVVHGHPGAVNPARSAPRRRPATA